MNYFLAAHILQESIATPARFFSRFFFQSRSSGSREVTYAAYFGQHWLHPCVEIRSENGTMNWARRVQHKKHPYRTLLTRDLEHGRFNIRRMDAASNEIFFLFCF